jgi:hypothetical protein
MGPSGGSDVLACSVIEKLELSEPENDVYYSIPASTANFDRYEMCI